MTSSNKREVAQNRATLLPMTAAWLAQVVRVEQSVFDDPWLEADFQAAIDAGYIAQLLTISTVATAATEPVSELVGYFVASRETNGVHLRKITVVPGYQCRGWARYMLDALVTRSRSDGETCIWLDVRHGNFRAQTVYQRYGFELIGTRTAYYESHAPGQREDSLAMKLAL